MRYATKDLFLEKAKEAIEDGFYSSATDAMHFIDLTDEQKNGLKDVSENDINAAYSDYIEEYGRPGIDAISDFIDFLIETNN